MSGDNILNTRRNAPQIYAEAHHNLRRRAFDLEFMSTAITLMKLVGREMPSIVSNFECQVLNRSIYARATLLGLKPREEGENACTTSRRHLKRCKTEYDKAEDLIFDKVFQLLARKNDLTGLMSVELRSPI